MTTFGSLFSGIGGFDLGLVRAGMSCKWQVEIDNAAVSVLDRRFPGVTKYKDVKNVGRNTLEPVDVICGGFPCQDLSIAGKRAGLAGERSGLWHEFARIIDELEPQWVVIENVPGLLSSNRGADFAVIIRWLAERGYGVCWRVLDSQYFGVAQRRRRVFIVGSFRDGRAAEVLFEREGSARDTPPSREKGQGTAGAITPGAHPGGYNGQDAYTNNIVTDPVNYNIIPDVAHSVRTMSGGIDREDMHTLIAHPMTFDPINITSKANRTRVEPGLPASTLHSGGLSIAWHNKQQSGELRLLDDLSPKMSKYWGGGGGNVPFVGVRRLTPTECERLQGFPDGWTDGQSDSARYRQLGNAVTVNVIEWIGRRLMEQIKCPWTSSSNTT